MTAALPVIRYRTLRGAIISALYGVVVGVLALLVGAIPDNVFMHLVGLLSLTFTFFFTRRALRVGVEIDKQDLVVRASLHVTRIPITQITGLQTHRRLATKVVYLELDDGQILPTPLIQGARTSSPSGRTKDVVAELRRQLGFSASAARVRAAQAPTSA